MVNSSLKPVKPKPIPPFDRIQEWSVINKGVTIYVNYEIIPLLDGVSLDVEHDGNGTFVGIGMYSPHANACYYWSDWALAKQLVIPKFIAHNGTSDLKYLKQWGFNVDESHLLWDTMLMQHIIDSSQHDYSLKGICKREAIGEWPKYEDIVGKKRERTLLDFPIEAVAEYNSCDTFYCYQLAQKQGFHQDREVFPPHSYFNDVEKSCAKIFSDMSDRGISIDLNYLRELKEHLEEQIQPVKEQIFNELGPINLDSPKQLLGALNAKDIFPEFNGKPSTDKRGMERLKGHPLVDKLLYYSELSTLLSSFVYPYLDRGADAPTNASSFIVHPYFNQVGTRTGRLSCSNPNLLQIPKRSDNGKLVRKMFVSRDGFVLGDCDFGQIEPRIMAHFSKDKGMCEMFTRGVDFHTFTAEKLKIDREKAKILNLSVGYRATFKSVSSQLKCTEQEAQKEIDEWWRMFPELRNWQDKLIWQTKKNGYFTTLLGRRIKVDNLNEYNKWKREHAERQLINNIAQASAAEVMKRAMIKVSYLSHIYPLVQVYDELLCEMSLASMQYFNLLETLKLTMENAVKLDVPLTVEAKSGLNWAEVN